MPEDEHDQERYVAEFAANENVSRVDGLQSLCAPGPDEVLMQSEEEHERAEAGGLHAQICRVVLRFTIGEDPRPAAVAGRVFFLCSLHAPELVRGLAWKQVGAHAFACRPRQMDWSTEDPERVRRGFAMILGYFMMPGCEDALQVARRVFLVARVFDYDFLRAMGLATVRALGRHLGDVRGATIHAAFKRDVAEFVERNERRDGRSHGSFAAAFQKTAANRAKLAEAQRRTQRANGANRCKGKVKTRS
jgi:hypothetical protein